MLVMRSTRHVLCINSENDPYVNDRIVFNSEESRPEDLSSLSVILEGSLVEDIDFSGWAALLIPNEATGQTATYPNMHTHLHLSNGRTLTVSLHYDKQKGGLFNLARIN